MNINDRIIRNTIILFYEILTHRCKDLDSTFFGEKTYRRIGNPKQRNEQSQVNRCWQFNLVGGISISYQKKSAIWRQPLADNHRPNHKWGEARSLSYQTF